jgi:hypothetical protein
MHADGTGQNRSGGNNNSHDDILLKPWRWSTLPSVAASVSTRVVSWKEAAAMKLSVSMDAFVIPNRIGSTCGGLTTGFDNFLVGRR